MQWTTSEARTSDTRSLPLPAPPELGSPAETDVLRRPLERQGVGFHVAGDDAARADVGAIADLEGRHQRGVGADKGAGAHVGEVLLEAVVVAEDGAGADVGTLADPAVADVGEMIGLGARLQARVLHLDEVADVDLRANVRPRPQPRERPHAGAGADVG